MPKIHPQVTFFSDYTKLYLFNWLFTSESKGEFNIRSGVTSEEPYLHIQSAPPNNHGKKKFICPVSFPGHRHYPSNQNNLQIWFR